VLRVHGLGLPRRDAEAARIELLADQLTNLLSDLQDGALRGELVEAFQELGFSAVSLDLEGLVSGKLNRELPR